MFGFRLGKHKRALEIALSNALEPLKDELGNVPIPMQTDPAFNGYILGICQHYAKNHHLSKTGDIAAITDAAFEELYRVESIAVQERIDDWLQQENAAFIATLTAAQTHNTAPETLHWLTDYAQQHFEPATGKML